MPMQKFFLASLVPADFAKDAEAMRVSASGLGQVPIAPYDTINAGTQTQINIANRSDQSKALLSNYASLRRHCSATIRLSLVS
ncbi:MAG: hypothetical protein SGI99_02895 [Pseudomonadota bacterium]|nr:hypothetical protein [Pseudomonadota bacterium]